MPPANFLLSKLPAEIDHSTVTKMGKVTEAKIQVLYQNAKFLNRLKIRTDLLKPRYVEVSNGTATAKLGLGAGFLGIFFRACQDGLGLLNRYQLGIELGDEAIGLRQCKYSLVLCVFVVVRQGLLPRISSFSTPLFCTATVGVGVHPRVAKSGQFRWAG
jgi:hypothetical protein